MPEPNDMVRPGKGVDFMPLLLLLLGVGMQFVHFLSAPPGISGDAARLGLYAFDFLQDNLRPFYIYHQFAPNPFVVYLQAFAFSLFGFTITALRGVTAFGGALAVPVAYLAGSELFRGEGRVVARRAGFVAALGMALDPFVNLYCRYGIEGAWLPVLELSAVLFLWRGLRRGKPIDFCLAGVFVGLSQYVYIVARWFPIALAIACGAALVAERHLFTRWRGLALAALSAAIVALPQWLLFLRMPYTLLARTQNSANLFDLPLSELLNVVVSKLTNQLLMIGVRWDNGYNPHSVRPLLNPILFGGFLLALAATAARRRAGRVACVVLAALMLLPDLLVKEGLSPLATRVFPAVPFIFLAAGLGCALLWSWAERRPRIPAWIGYILPVAVLVAGIESQWNFATYVQPQVDSTPGLEWRASLVEIAEADYIAEHADPAFLLPSSEYQRAPLTFLLADSYPRRAGGYPVPLASGDSVTVILPAEPDRPTTEGIPAGYISGEWTLLRDGRAYFLPPLPNSVDPTGPAEALWASNGALAAHVFPARWHGTLPEVRPVNASFSNGLDLVGYQASSLSAGQPLTITLYWTPRTRIEDDVQIFVQLLDRNNEARVGIHDWPMHGAYRVPAWQPGETVPLSYQFSIPSDLAPGAYRLVCGVVDLTRQTRIPLVDGEEFATVATLKMPLPDSDAVPARSIDARFGSAIDLTGYTLSPVASGLEVTLFWHASGTPQSDYTIFIHLVDATDQIVAQSDVQPLDGQYPTSIWSAGETVVDQRVIPVPAGHYQVYVGLYQWQTQERLSVLSEGRRVLEDGLLLDSVMVP
jgi:4-amino-4-deoxy-L-arabinose transferase-like glycosyltransferase